MYRYVVTVAPGKLAILQGGRQCGGLVAALPAAHTVKLCFIHAVLLWMYIYVYM